MSFRLIGILGLATISVLAAACADPDEGREHDSDSAAVSQQGSAARFLGDALAELSAPSAAFYLNRGSFNGQPDVVTTRVLGGKVDRAGKKFALDFSPVVGARLPDATAKALGSIFTFELPASALGGATSLDDPTFAALVGDAAARAQAARRGRDGVPEVFVDGAAYAEERRQACASANFPASVKVPITFQNEDRTTTTIQVPIDCHFFERQTASKATLTPFELASLVIYTSSEYSAINRLLRSRTFHEPDPDFATDPALEERATEALWALGALSALNKLDPVTKTTYRGVADIYPSCAPDAQNLAPAPTTIEAAIDRFCGYFGSVRTYRDCGFGSSSLDSDVALSFAKVSKVTNVTSEGAEFQDEPVPQEPKIPIVYAFSGRTGAEIRGLSLYPYEKEVLFRPSAGFNVDAGSRKIALSPLTNATHTKYDEFELVACGTAFSEEQKARVSHFRVNLREP